MGGGVFWCPLGGHATLESITPHFQATHGGRQYRPTLPRSTTLATTILEIELLNSNLCANLGHFLRDLLSLFFGDRFFNWRGRLVNDCLGLFQAKTCNLTHNFDDVDLVWTNLCEDSIKLGLLFNLLRGRCGFGCCCHWACSGRYWRSAHAPFFLQSLGQLYQFEYIQLLDFGNNGI